MKNLYSLTPKQLASIRKQTPPPANHEPSEKPPAQRPNRQQEYKPQFDAASPQPPTESWWGAVLQDGSTEKTVPSRETRPHSAERAVSPYDWSAARELYECDGIAELNVTGVNRGGLLVEGEKLRGFVPLSHLIGVPSLQTESERQAAMQQKIGSSIRAKIIEFDPERGRVVFSERAAQAAPGRRAELMARLNVGDQVKGEVTNVTNFGVFIDLGGMEGLVHLSEISWGRVHNPADFVSIGDTVDVEVISVDREQSRVALSLKRLQVDPWTTVPERYIPGSCVPCRITHVANFGAFASLEEGVEGLIHVSELSDTPFSHPRNIVSEGEELEARVISVDVHTRRLALSLRKIEFQEVPEEDLAPPEKPESGSEG